MRGGLASVENKRACISERLPNNNTAIAVLRPGLSAFFDDCRIYKRLVRDNETEDLKSMEKINELSRPHQLAPMLCQELRGYATPVDPDALEQLLGHREEIAALRCEVETLRREVEAVRGVRSDARRVNGAN